MAVGHRGSLSQVSARGPSMQWQEPVFSSDKGLSVVFVFPSSSSAKEWECPRGVGPRAAHPSPHPTSSDRGQGLGPSPWLWKSLPGPQIPAVRGSWEPLVAGPALSNFPLSRPRSCPPPWLQLLALSLCSGLRGEGAPAPTEVEEPIRPASCCQSAGRRLQLTGLHFWSPPGI